MTKLTNKLLRYKVMFTKGGTHVDIINNKIVECKYYLLEGRDNTSNKDFLVAYNGDLYYWDDYNNLIELID